MVLLLTFCSEENPEPVNEKQWKSLGLNSHIINKLQIYQNKIYVGTDKGFFVKKKSEMI
jgi:hypothetical protein